MESSRIITLFAEVPPVRRGPSAFVVSMVLHVVVMGLLYLNLRHAIRVEDEAIVQRYTVRMLNLQRPEHKIRPPAESFNAQAVRAAAGKVASGGRPSAPALPQQLAQLVPAPQTLVQPDLPNLLLPQATPIPLILLWSPESSIARKIVPPPPLAKTSAKVRPDLHPPNHELQLADLKISASAFATDTPVPLPSTTSPLVVRGPQPVKQVPETTSKPAGPPVPARVLSLSDVRLDQGTIALPAANETSVAGPSETIAPARQVNSSQEGNGNTATKQDGNGAGAVPGDQPGKGAAGADSVGGRESAKNGSDTGASHAADVGSGSKPSVTRIVMPKDGRFGAVVVGSSMAEEYPEAIGLWGSRLAYTVYLHVGLSKSWILQYCLPPGASAANNGAVTRLEAPWPYLMERPELAAEELNTDAIMIHGFINTSGRFEKLAIVSPVGFAQTKFVLNALEQWEFRAAMQNGLMTTVEVLLIIPVEAG
jgi:hypothetical protein